MRWAYITRVTTAQSIITKENKSVYVTIGISSLHKYPVAVASPLQFSKMSVSDSNNLINDKYSILDFSDVRIFPCLYNKCDYMMILQFIISQFCSKLTKKQKCQLQ